MTSRASPDPSEPLACDFAAKVGATVRRLRLQRGLTLERFSKTSGVSRGMLSRIELAQSTPTIGLLWKIATALELPFWQLLEERVPGGGALVKVTRAMRLESADRRVLVRRLLPALGARTAEFYEVRLPGVGFQSVEAKLPGTRGNLVVSEGDVEFEMGGERHRLGPGDAIAFEADLPYAYRNRGGSEAVMYLVTTFPDQIDAELTG